MLSRVSGSSRGFAKECDRADVGTSSDGERRGNNCHYSARRDEGMQFCACPRCEGKCAGIADDRGSSAGRETVPDRKGESLMDKIEIRDLECYCHHGVLEE